MRVCGQMTEFSTRARSSTKKPWPNTELMICAHGLIWQSSPIMDELSISETVAASNWPRAPYMNSRHAVREPIRMDM